MPEPKTTNFKYKYVGGASKPFWKQVRSVKNARRRRKAYSLGCAIQHIESVLEELIGGKRL